MWLFGSKHFKLYIVYKADSLNLIFVVVCSLDKWEKTAIELDYATVGYPKLSKLPWVNHIFTKFEY